MKAVRESEKPSQNDVTEADRMESFRVATH